MVREAMSYRDVPVKGSMASWTSVWSAIEKQRKFSEDLEKRVEFLEKQVLSLQNKEKNRVDAIGKVVA